MNILQELDAEVNKLISKEERLLEGVKDSIKEAKMQRNSIEDRIMDEDSEIDF
jgi:hypothetical protein